MFDIETLEKSNLALEMIIKLMMEEMVKEGMTEEKTKEIFNKSLGKAIFVIMGGE